MVSSFSVFLCASVSPFQRIITKALFIFHKTNNRGHQSIFQVRFCLYIHWKLETCKLLFAPDFFSKSTQLGRDLNFSENCNFSTTDKKKNRIELAKSASTSKRSALVNLLTVCTTRKRIHSIHFLSHNKVRELSQTKPIYFIHRIQCMYLWNYRYSHTAIRLYPTRFNINGPQQNQAKPAPRFKIELNLSVCVCVRALFFSRWFLFIRDMWFVFFFSLVCLFSRVNPDY